MTLKSYRNWKLTLFGRSLLLITLELFANAVCWIVAGLLFGRREETRGTMSLALLAWTIALDADHISAIDNATRGLISLGQLPVTCGLFFSLGHSTIVIAVNVAIAISTSVYDKVSGVSNVGGIVGTAVSASFLFIIGLANSVILARVLRNRRRRKRAMAASTTQDNGEARAVVTEVDEKSERSIMMRIIGPVTTFVDKPWKMYPVGVLFGFGFDTASSIALLAISALAEKNNDGKGIAQANIVVLPFLFTVGMTLVDSADSVLMLYAYAGGLDRTFALFERRTTIEKDTIDGDSPQCARQGLDEPAIPQTLSVECVHPPELLSNLLSEETNSEPRCAQTEVQDSKLQLRLEPAIGPETSPKGEEQEDVTRRNMRVKQHTMSTLSLVLTLISILVAFSISLIEFMGLIGERCRACQRAAEDPDGGGLAGSWWRGWAKANDDSGFIGAAIVGGFVIIVAGWYGCRWIIRKTRKDPEEHT
ncbi:hypothetical protein EW145_g6371 [Phellinidium pouzarii]|uniref:Nickel/cobalt efflux system n=1 Tax=Phellinidium pouzarii TaxID=167371 RepID=A0A4S4KXD6_9AGAM|nr:hypothetical protein EW145_g6371 [Phellinidium pouzarii]